MPKKASSGSTKKPAAPKPAARKAAPVKPAAKPASEPVVTVADYMTRSPHTIDSDQSLERAHELMNKHRVRHLPVLEDGQLVGVVSQRDLYFIETLDGAARASIKVEEAMTTDVFSTTPDATLASVTSAMVKKKLGCAVITEGNKVIGIYSTIDAMRALLERL